jgi:hypothetical protein
MSAFQRVERPRDAKAFGWKDVEVHMRKFSLTLATSLLALGIATSADALPISSPAGLRAAIDDTSMTQKVWWGWGGYYRPAYVVAAPVVVVPAPVVVVPRVYAPVFWRPRPRFYARPVFWGGPRFYGRRYYGW